jgi:long-chain acyl-CoA synthetase
MSNASGAVSLSSTSSTSGSATDVGSASHLPPTIAELPFLVGGRFPKADLLGQCRDGRIAHVTGQEVLERVRDLSLGLSACGMRAGDRVALVSESRPEWLLADLAILAAGAVTTPIYPTLPDEQLAFILRDSDASLAIVSTARRLKAVAAAAERLPALRTIVVMDPPPGAMTAPVPVVTLEQVAERGHQRILDGWGVAREFRDVARGVAPTDLATVVYTSGTTGEPKGVMLTHGNLAANLADICEALPFDDTDVALSVLPLCHSFERMVAYVYLARGVSMVFAQSPETLARDLAVVRPTLMTGVPRVFEKLRARVLERGRDAGGLTRAVFEWAMQVAATSGRQMAAGGSVGGWPGVKRRLADRLVFRTVRDGLGGRLRFAVSGGAPLHPRLGEWFSGLGVPILEGYGLTETAPVLTVMRLGAVRFGTVGRALAHVDLRLAEDGEILARGPNVMAGYYKRPAETAAVLREGWFHTGDVGSIDADGYLAITDRKKDLIVTSGGKKIAPQPIERELSAHALVAEAVVVGEERHFPVALLVPDFVELSRHVAAAPPASLAEAQILVERPEVIALFQTVVDALNARLAQFERIKKFAILPQELTSGAGELTPTLKVKRGVVEQKYRQVIDRLYGDRG